MRSQKASFVRPMARVAVGLARVRTGVMKVPKLGSPGSEPVFAVGGWNDVLHHAEEDAVKAGEWAHACFSGRRRASRG